MDQNLNELTSVELECLNSVADDYEDLVSIKRMAPMLQEHSNSEVLQALKALIRRGLVEAYKYEVVAQKFEPLKEELSITESSWFYITNQGKEFLNTTT